MFCSVTHVDFLVLNGANLCENKIFQIKKVKKVIFNVFNTRKMSKEGIPSTLTDACHVANYTLDK